ncbi:unnamed protein product [Periconia digitata]|uniref:F-box domain-containing protein n=1 Tax=Periconia digitata TaxID=1303443 RepID=A0A9W4UIU5_9PLEO|nr:unnamed protein product [Periconia digitata]
MDQLPQELIDRICALLAPEDLKSTATLSHRIQYASEKASRVWEQITMSEQDLEMFVARCTDWRWRFLRHVAFRTHIPAYEDDPEREPESNHCRESEAELNEKDVRFTQQIRSLFETLNRMEAKRGPGNFRLTIYTPVRATLEETCPHRKCPSWRLHLLNPEKLPSLCSIHTIYLEDERMIYPLEEPESLLKIDLRMLLDLAVKLPKLRLLGCKINAGGGWTTNCPSEATRHYTKNWVGPICDSRDGFAQAFEDLSLPQTLRSADLNLMWPLSEVENIDQTMPLPNLLGAAHTDRFSSSLSLLSQRLRMLQIQVIADETLFWPTNAGASWPCLERLHVALHIATPSGSWYFQDPRGSENILPELTDVTSSSYPPLVDTPDDERWDYETSDYGLDLDTVTNKKYRVTPDETTLRPLLLSLATAAAHMPKLKAACVWFPLQWDAGDVDGYEDFDPRLKLESMSGSSLDSTAWGIVYLGPGEEDGHESPGFLASPVYRAASPGIRQMAWATGPWRPDAELHGLFGRIGDASIPLVEHWPKDNNRQIPQIISMFRRYDIFCM